MPGMGERAYTYAKACGILGKSFVGRRIAGLGAITRLSELDRLIFPQSFRDLPERELLVDLERRIINRAAGQIMTIVNGYKNPPELLVRLLRSYEYGDLKTVLAALGSGESWPPGFTDLGRFRTVNFAAYPDLPGMIRGTEFESLLRKRSPEDAEDIHLQTALDQQYYTYLWDSLFMLPKPDRLGIELILAEEISLRNVVWVLRMRTYYRMAEEEIRERLVLLGDRKSRGLAEDAVAILDLPLDTYAAWESWKRRSLLNGERPGESWQVDPRFFQNAASEYLYTLARRHFHRSPFSISTAACFIKLKQFEEDLLTSIAEGLGLGIPSRDVFALLEVEP